MKKRFTLISLLLFSYATWGQATPLVTYTPAMQPLMQVGNAQPGLQPLPKTLSQNGKNVLTLRKAILYGMQHNNNLQVALITRQINRSNLVVAREKFMPQLSLAPNASVTQSSGDGLPSTTQTNINVGPAVSWLMPEGTKLSVNAAYNPNRVTGTNGWSQDMSWEVQVSQPLLQGFGFAVNEAGLKQAENTQLEDDITLQKNISETLSTIISDYFAVVKAQAAAQIAQQALQASEHQVYVSQQKYLAGQVARLQVVQGRLDVATAKQSLTQAQQTLQSAKLTLLNDLGLPWNTRFSVSDDIQLSPYEPNLLQSDDLALKQNRNYLSEQLTLKNDQLAVVTARDAMRWQLNLNLSTQQQIQDAATASSLGLASTNDTLRTNTATLNLTIPFGQTSQKAALESAVLQVQEDKSKLDNMHQQILNQIQTDITNLNSQWQSIKISEEELKLAQENYQAAKVKLSYGKIDAFTLSQQHKQLVQDENSVISNKIDYIEQVAKFEQYIGVLLQSWNIHVKAPQSDELDD